MGPRRPPPLFYEPGRTANEGEMYARIIKTLGEYRFECACSDGTTRIGKVRGVLVGRMFVRVGDFVIVSLRDFDPRKVDIVWRFRDGDPSVTDAASECGAFP